MKAPACVDYAKALSSMAVVGSFLAYPVALGAAEGDSHDWAAVI
jgi:hypothetical protein